MGAPVTAAHKRKKKRLTARLLKAARAARMTTEDLASFMDCSPQSVVRWRQGKSCPHKTIPDLRAAVEAVEEKAGIGNNHAESTRKPTSGTALAAIYGAILPQIPDELILQQAVERGLFLQELQRRLSS